jgi:hypothetical protein
VIAPPETIEFWSSDPSALGPRLGALALERDGWVNLHPLVPPEDVPRNSLGLLGWVQAKGPAVPEATWVPGPVSRRGQQQPDSVGLQHNGGPKARLRLADEGVPIPDGWRVRADHPRRGLVLEVPSGTDPQLIVSWLLRAARALSTITLPDAWVAAFHKS